MTDPNHLWLFVPLAFGIIVLPGVDMAFIVGSAITGGRSRGLMALAGIASGGVCHVVMTSLGIGMLVKVLPGAFNALLIAGAAYIAWIGISLLRSRHGIAMQPEQQVRDDWATFRQGLATSLLNPKAYLFMLAVFPQFLRPEYGGVWIQALILWLVIAGNQCIVYGSMVLLAGRVRGWLQRSPAASTLAARCVGVLLVGTAMFTGIGGWQRL